MPRTIAEENSMLGAYNWKISRDDESGTKLQGYVKPQYTKPGLTISFHASTELDDCQFFLRIYRQGGIEVLEQGKFIDPRLFQSEITVYGLRIKVGSTMRNVEMQLMG